MELRWVPCNRDKNRFQSKNMLGLQSKFIALDKNASTSKTKNVLFLKIDRNPKDFEYILLQ